MQSVNTMYMDVLSWPSACDPRMRYCTLYVERIYGLGHLKELLPLCGPCAIGRDWCGAGTARNLSWNVVARTPSTSLASKSPVVAALSYLPNLDDPQPLLCTHVHSRACVTTAQSPTTYTDTSRFICDKRSLWIWRTFTVQGGGMYI